jgi:hypothetical protein
MRQHTDVPTFDMDAVRELWKTCSSFSMLRAGSIRCSGWTGVDMNAVFDSGTVSGAGKQCEERQVIARSSVQRAVDILSAVASSYFKWERSVEKTGRPYFAQQ